MPDEATTWAVTPEGVNQMLVDSSFGSGNACVELSPTHAVARE